MQLAQSLVICTKEEISDNFMGAKLLLNFVAKFQFYRHVKLQNCHGNIWY